MKNKFILHKLGFCKAKKSFTLVEIVIVVAIIALLSVLAIPNLLRSRVNANDTMAKASLKSISTALENYLAINQSYPTTTTPLLIAAPPYLSVDYFTGIYNGFSYTANLTNYTYFITAIPTSPNLGSTTFTVSTGGVMR